MQLVAEKKKTMPAALSSMEYDWIHFLMELKPWEIHKLHQVGEMELHDKFVRGLKTKDEVFELICRDGEEETFSQRVGEESDS